MAHFLSSSPLQCSEICSWFIRGPGLTECRLTKNFVGSSQFRLFRDPIPGFKLKVQPNKGLKGFPPLLQCYLQFPLFNSLLPPLSLTHLKFKNKIHVKISEKGKYLAQQIQEITIMKGHFCLKPHEHDNTIAAIET